MPITTAADDLDWMHRRRHLLQRLGACGGFLAAAALSGCASSPARRPRSDGAAGAPLSSAVPPLPQPGLSLITLPEAGRTSVVQLALQQQGVPYRWAGSDPALGFDCSGLMVYAFQQALGASLPRQSSDLAAVSRPLAPERLQPGDFVFFNTLGRPYSHLGLYTGGGQFVHAPSSGGRVSLVRLDNRYFAPRFNGARTLFI